MMEKLDQSTRLYLKKRRLNKEPTPEDERALQKIRNDFKQAMKAGDEKIELAAATYELVRLQLMNGHVGVLVLMLLCGRRWISTFAGWMPI